MTNEIRIPIKADDQASGVLAGIVREFRPALAGLADPQVDADDGLHALVLGGLVEVEDAVHVAVVGDADGRLAVGGRGGHDIFDARRTVEHRVLGVHVQVSEVAP